MLGSLLPAKPCAVAMRTTGPLEVVVKHWSVIEVEIEIDVTGIWDLQRRTSETLLREVG